MYHGKIVVFIAAESARVCMYVQVYNSFCLLPTAAVWYFEVGVI